MKLSARVLTLVMWPCALAWAQTDWQAISAYNDGVTRQIEAQRQAGAQMDHYAQMQQQSAGGGYAYDSGPSVDAAIAQQMAAANDNALRKRHYVGALAYDVENLRWEWQVDAESTGRAIYELGKSCPMERCPLVAVFQNTCIAAAHSKTDHRYFWADAEKPKQAAQAALQACETQSGQRCEAAKELAICTGYRYLASPDKLNRFQRAGLIGLFAPSAAGIARSPPAAVDYNPRLKWFQALPTAEQQTAEARAGALGQSAAWGAFALSPSTSKLAFALSLTATGAEAAAKVQCGARDCLIAQRFQGATCIASGIGNNAAGQGMFFLQQGTDQAQADAAMDRECAKAGAACGAKQRFCFPAL